MLRWVLPLINISDLQMAYDSRINSPCPKTLNSALGWVLHILLTHWKAYHLFRKQGHSVFYPAWVNMFFVFHEQQFTINRITSLGVKSVSPVFVGLFCKFSNEFFKRSPFPWNPCPSGQFLEMLWLLWKGDVRFRVVHPVNLVVKIEVLNNFSCTGRKPLM